MRTCIHALFAILSPALCADWKLVWSDEFNGTKLDYSKWGIEQNAFGGGNHEQQIYTDRSKNVRVENGSLILEAHKDNAQISGTQRPYSSGSFLIETIFDINGFGLLGFKSVLDRDIPVVMGIFLLSATLMLLGNIISDILVALVDPRVRFN